LFAVFSKVYLLEEDPKVYDSLTETIVSSEGLEREKTIGTYFQVNDDVHVLHINLDENQSQFVHEVTTDVISYDEFIHKLCGNPTPFYL
jgi:hypothetical protein